MKIYIYNSASNWNSLVKLNVVIYIQKHHLFFIKPDFCIYDSLLLFLFMHWYHIIDVKR